MLDPQARLFKDIDKLDGKDLLEKIQAYTQKYFSQPKGEESSFKIAGKQIRMDLGEMKDYSSSLKFLSGPTVPQYPLKPKKKLITALAFFLEWCSANKEVLKTR